MEIKLYQETCVTAGCGIAFWVDEKYRERRLEKKDSFFCPNGHSMHYVGETDAAKVIRLRNEKATMEREKNEEIERLKKALRAKGRKKKK